MIATNSKHVKSVAIEVDRLSKFYRGGWFNSNSFRALNEVSFQVNQGEIFGLLGPNGAGKTTFIKILLGIIKKSSGHATLLGHPAGSRKGSQYVGYLPEQLRIPRHMTAYTALDYYGSLSHVPASEIRARRQSILELVGLAGRERDSVTKYSKGMLQRLGLAQAMLHRPQLLVLDEPTDGLDPRARAEMRNLLHQLRDEGVTIFLNSHILQEVELVCDKVAILDRGNLRYSGSVSEIGQFVSQGQSLMAVRLELLGTEDQVREPISQWDTARCQVNSLQAANGQIVLDCNVTDQDALDFIVDQLRQARISITGLKLQETSLEDAFLKILDAPTEATPLP